MDNTQLLLHMYEDQRSQLSFRRSRENEIFIWTASVLLVFVGGALLVSRDDRSALLQNFWGVLLASVALLLITIFSVVWQLKQRLQVMGTPQERQFLGDYEVLQCCITGAGFGYHDYSAIWLQTGRVVGISTYKDHAPGSSCRGHFRDFRVEDAPQALLKRTPDGAA